jgi:hypothetical protein
VFTLRPRNRGSARTPLIGLTLLVALSGLLVGSQAASASSARCKGTATPQKADPLELDYQIKCSEEIKAFSIISTLPVSGFSVAPDVVDPATRQVLGDQSLTCEGSIPSNGFGCYGKALNPNLIVGTMSTETPSCVLGRPQLTLWVVATDALSKSSEPYKLNAQKCPAPKKKKGKKGSK